MMEDWAIVLIQPSFWWRVKSLFSKPDILFVYGNGWGMTQGIDGTIMTRKSKELPEIIVKEINNEQK